LFFSAQSSPSSPPGLIRKKNGGTKQSFSEYLRSSEVSSSSSSSGKQGLGMVVRTFLPPDNSPATRKKIFEIASTLAKNNGTQRETAVFTKSLSPCMTTIWPIAPLTQSGDKFGGMIIPPFLSSDSVEWSKEIRFVFFKPDSMHAAIELSKDEFGKFLNQSERFIQFFRSVEGQQIMIGESLQGVPDPVILKETSEERVLYQVDPPFKTKPSNGKPQNTYCPTVSLRFQTRKSNSSGWGIQSPGDSRSWRDAIFPQIMMGGSSLFFFVNG
jgi:hypothetical protein